MKTALQVVLGIVALVVATVLLMVYGFGIEMFGLSLGKHVENKRTEVIRSTNQYATTQQQLLLQYAREYEAAKADGSEAQAATIKAQMESVAVTLDPTQVPPSAAAIIGR